MTRAQILLLAAASLDAMYVAGQRKNIDDSPASRIACVLALEAELKRQAPELFVTIFDEQPAQRGGSGQGATKVGE